MRALTMVVVLLAIAWPAPARASCAYTGPLCQNWKGYDAIFDGTVRSIQRIDRDEEIGDRTERIGHRLVTFEVHEWWRGQPAKQVELFLWGGTWPDGGVVVSGGFDVRVGERYVIFAHRNPRGELTTSDCFGSSRYAGASHQLAFLRSLKDGTARPRIQGRLGGPYSPVEGSQRTELDAVVRLTGDAGVTETQVRTGAPFQFTNLAPGVYTVSVQGPAHVVAVPSTQTVTLDDPHSCREVMAHFRHDTSISGVVVDRARTPLKQVSVEAAPAATWKQAPSSRITSQTDETGRFELSGLPPGEYVVGVNLLDDVRYNAYAQALYAAADGRPETIVLVSGQHAWLGQWSLPPALPVVKMRLRVVDPDGQPVRRATVHLLDVTNPDTPEFHRTVYADATDDRGFIEFEGRQGRVYAVERSSRRSSDSAARSQPFPAVVATSGIVVTLPGRR